MVDAAPSVRGGSVPSWRSVGIYVLAGRTGSRTDLDIWAANANHVVANRMARKWGTESTIVRKQRFLRCDDCFRRRLQANEYPGRGSNPHVPFGTTDFKSVASAYSATGAFGRWQEDIGFFRQRYGLAGLIRMILSIPDDHGDLCPLLYVSSETGDSLGPFFVVSASAVVAGFTVSFDFGSEATMSVACVTSGEWSRCSVCCSRTVLTRFSM